MFENGADFAYSRFELMASFGGSYFLKPVNFWGSEFNSMAFFDYAIFMDGIHFGEIRAYSGISFRGVNFKSWVRIGGVYDSIANFQGAIFESDSGFESIRFNGSARFWKTRFDSTANFGYTRFSSLATFSQSTFRGWVNFKNSEFISFADFERVQFDSVSFQNTNFNSVANFNEAKFQGKVNLNGCLLPDTLIFTGVQSSQEIDFTYALTDSIQSGDRCVIDLYGTDLSKIKFDYSRFKILTDSSKYQRRQLGNIYEKILKMQNEQGFLDGYEVVDKEYRQFKNTYNKSGFSYFLGAISSWYERTVWDYGYRKELIFLWTFVLFAFFFFVNHLLFPYLNRCVYRIDNTYGQTPQALLLRNELLTVIRLFKIRNIFNALFYTSLVFFGLRLNTDKIQFKHFIGASYLLIQYTIGIICLAYLANVIILS